MSAAGVCRSCGIGLLVGARFCHGCARPVESASGAAEFKQVTVLFADVVGSMDIAAVVGPERLREIMSGLIDCATAVVERYGGTVDKFTGDGIMALFGAPVALEDHAVRACRAALEIQVAVRGLAEQVAAVDGVELRLRIGLNSGQVIAGEMGAAYTAVGEQVGMAQRMEAAAPPSGVMLSASTARLVADDVVLGDAELVAIKGSAVPVQARRLLGVADHRVVHAAEVDLVGRGWELDAATGLLERAIAGRGAVLGLVGAPGIGKSRLTAELSAAAAARGVEVFGTYCESHAGDIAFGVVARLLRTTTGVAGLDAAAARAQIRAAAPDADPEDLVLFDDLLGVADPAVPVPVIDPDARRRRLTALVNSRLLARTEPAVYVLEDAHWIDGSSEAMLAEFLTVIAATPSLVVITYRPDYGGALSRVAGAQTIALAPLGDADIAALVGQVLGRNPSVARVGAAITAASAGNPFFALELVRDVAERGVLTGQRGHYTSEHDVRVTVPPTVQATIAARIDRLPSGAKRALGAAAVIGSRFGPELLATLGVDPELDGLVAGEFLDQTGAEYEFHHPLIRTVAYEAQLKSERAELHRRVAQAIEARGTPDADAALIAEHREAAGDMHEAYGWHMRAAGWNTNRDINAARVSWERAQEIADALPVDDSDRTALRIAPRTMLCGTAWRVHEHVVAARFEEHRELCTAVGDKASLAIAMVGLVMDHLWQDRMDQASRLASGAWTLIESLGDPTLTVGLANLLIYAKSDNAEWSETLRWSQSVIDLADGDSSRGGFISGSPLALAFTTRAVGRYCLGHGGWRDDSQRGLAMARNADPMSYAFAVAWAYFPTISNGVLNPTDAVLREIEDASRIAERSSDDLAVTFVRTTLAVALVHRQTTADRDRGARLLAEVSDAFVRQGYMLSELPLVDVFLAREVSRSGSRDQAIPRMRAVVDQLFREERLLGWGIPTTGVLVETLLDRGADGDVAEAEAAIDRLAYAQAEPGLAARDIWVLKLRTLLARVRGDTVGYRGLRDRYREMANTLGFEGHLEWSEAMP